MFLFNWDFYSIYSIIHIYKRIFILTYRNFYIFVYENKKRIIKKNFKKQLILIINVIKVM